MLAYPYNNILEFVIGAILGGFIGIIIASAILKKTIKTK